MFRSCAPSPIPGTVGSFFAPQNLPLNVWKGGPGDGPGPFVVREIRGVNFAFHSNALTDEPLWVRVDGPGTV